MSLYDQAFKAGYNDCLRSFSTGSTSLSSSDFNPPVEMRDAYVAGWQQATTERSAQLAKREHRGEIVVSLVLGSFLLTSGFAITFFSIHAHSNFFVIASGAMVSGVLLLIRAAVLAFRRRETEEEHPAA